MTRLTGGKARGIRLLVPKGLEVRPASDRVRQALFSILAHRIRDASLLDLYAGAGHYGLEGLSRGAQRATLVDRSIRAVQTAQENARRAGLDGACEVIRADVLRYLPTCQGPFDIIFLDPPYSQGLVQPTLELIDRHGLLDGEGTIVVEHEGSEAPQATVGLEIIDRRRYGRNHITLLASGQLL